MDGVSFEGPAAADNPGNEGAGLSDGSDGAVDQSSATSGGDTWSSALNEDNRGLVENKGWKSPDDALKSYRELDEYRGRSVALPGENATDEDWSSFRGKMGTPELADAYTFGSDDGADKDAVTSLKGLFHGAGLDQRQADNLYQSMLASLGDTQHASVEQQAQRLTQRKTDSQKELVDAWGNADGEVFKTNTEAARRAAIGLGGSDLFQELRDMGALSDDNKVLAPKLMKALAEVGTSMFAEDGFVSTGDVSAVNPFDKSSEDITAQSNLVKSNPSRARSLIRAANLRPEDYGLSSN